MGEPEVETTAIEVSEQHSMAVARPVISPDEAKEMVEELRQLIAKILVPQKHYMDIKGRDVLLKAGAEELGKFFGLSSAYSDLETHSDGANFFASVKCSVLNTTGRILAESYGFYGSDERTKGPKATANTVVKMAQKRAYVGAILTATGTSELFTQDIEQEEETPAPVGREATAEEVLVLKGLFAKKKPGTILEASEWIESMGDKGKTHQWVAEAVLGLIMRPDPEPELVPEPSLLDTDPNEPDDTEDTPF